MPCKKGLYRQYKSKKKARSNPVNESIDNTTLPTSPINLRIDPTNETVIPSSVQIPPSSTHTSISLITTPTDVSSAGTSSSASSRQTSTNITSDYLSQSQHYSNKVAIEKIVTLLTNKTSMLDQQYILKKYCHTKMLSLYLIYWDTCKLLMYNILLDKTTIICACLIIAIVNILPLNRQ